MPVEHLYVHIPFCPKICPYCSFFKEASDHNKTQGFLDALLLQAERLADRLQPRTIFFGGGTPSALSMQQLDFLLGGLRERMDCTEVLEWTLEMNPATVSLQKAEVLLRHGVNRVSMGVQAWQPGLLQTLGRVHSAQQAEDSFRILREAGFKNLNLDLIFGIPGQTAEDWEESMEKTISLAPEHISCYCLTYEEDTEFLRSLEAGKFFQDETSECEMFLRTREVLGAAGYGAYEISNFSLPNRECLHNLAYWSGKDYFGIGPSAFSTVGGRRWRIVRDTARFTASTMAGSTEIDFEEDLSEATRGWERTAFGLRTAAGVPVEWVSLDEASRMQGEGLVEVVGGHCKITGRGWLLADEIATALAR